MRCLRDGGRETLTVAAVLKGHPDRNGRSGRTLTGAFRRRL
jgi:hypothetical protein